MSSIFLSFLVFLEVIGFSGAQNITENISSKIGFSDPFFIGDLPNEKENTPSVFTVKEGQEINDLQVTVKGIASYPMSKEKDAPKITADSAYVYDVASGKVLYSKNPDKMRPIASVTKVMTATVVIENFNLDEEVDVTPQAAWITGSKMHLYPYEKIKIKDLVAGMLIASGNDAAKALEYHIGREKLVSLMNEKAEWLGLTDTHFTEASGLNPENRSSVTDLTILASYAMKNSEFMSLVNKREYTAVSTDGKITHLIHTTNRLLNKYPDIFGLKTGYTEEAGNCLIAGAKRGDHKIISIVLGVPNYDIRFSESRDLLDWAFANFKW